MSFLTGLVTGLAKSVDDNLKKDMQRTQDRIDGMAQYRITRRRAKLEQQDREKKELSEVLTNLASLVDGDIDQAAQLYKAGGGTISSGKLFYEKLLKNKDTLGSDISNIVTFATENAPKGISLSDYVDNFSQGISKLPVSDDEVPTTGLYGALFKPKVGKQITKIVESTAPLGEEKEKFAVPTPTVKVEEMLAYKKYMKENKRKPGTTFESELIALNDELFNETDADKKAIIRGRIAKIETMMVKEAQLKKKATGSTSNFSKEKLSTLFFNSYKNSLDPKYLVKGLDDTLRIAFDGNEVPVLVAKKTVMEKLNTRFGTLGDKEFDNALKGEIQEFNVQKTKYIQGVVKDVNVNRNQAKNKIHTAPVITGNFTEAQKREKANAQIRDKIMKGEYKTGDLINYGNNEYRIVTNTGLL